MVEDKGRCLVNEVDWGEYTIPSIKIKNGVLVLPVYSPILLGCRGMRIDEESYEYGLDSKNDRSVCVIITFKYI